MEAVFEFTGKTNTGEVVDVSVFPDHIHWLEKKEDAGGHRDSGIVPLDEVEDTTVTKKLFRTMFTVTASTVTLEWVGKPAEAQQMKEQLDPLVAEAKKFAAARAVKRKREVGAILTDLRSFPPNQKLVRLGELHREGKLSAEEYADIQVRILGI